MSFQNVFRKEEKKVQVAWLFAITDQRVSYTAYASQLKILIIFLTQLKILIKILLGDIGVVGLGRC